MSRAKGVARLEAKEPPRSALLPAWAGARGWVGGGRLKKAALLKHIEKPK